jgi:glycosyltransferase involved in cell wall biosynthesis
MKICVDLSFSIPIWRFFYESDNKYIIPYEFIYKDKKYTNSISIIQFGWNITESRLIEDTNFLNENIILQTVRNCILCAPTLTIFNLLRKYRPKLYCCLANHNAFIDESLYKIDYSIEKKFDLIVSSAFSKYKNYHFIKNIKKSCAIGYFTSDTTIKTMPSLNTYCPNFEDKKRTKDNFKWVSPHTSCKYYNMSKIGGIFSIEEGACFSSSEYLLCGLPVLSCHCSGGREIWYNNENSVLCEPNEESVISNLELMINEYNKGKYDREKIRENHINQMDFHRNNLTNEVLKLMKMITLDTPEFEVLKDSLKYYHSNCMDSTININYKKQYLKESQAIEILGL